MKMANWLNKSWCRGIERDREEVTVRPSVVLWLLLRIKEDKLHPSASELVVSAPKLTAIQTKKETYKFIHSTVFSILYSIFDLHDYIMISNWFLKLKIKE